MKKQKRHISIKKNLSIGIVITLIVLISLLYLYHNCWKGVYIVNDVPTSFVGVGIIIVIGLTFCTIAVLGGILLDICFPSKSESKKQTKNKDD